MHGSLSSWSDIIDNLLVKDFLTLKLRIGAGTDTIYIFAPVVVPLIAGSLYGIFNISYSLICPVH